MPDIERLLQRVEQIYQLLKHEKQTAGLEYLVVRNGERSTLVPTSAIDWIEAKTLCPDSPREGSDPG